MKIKFQNLGAIKETELDLRPLTIIIGPNNSNKTYIAYSTYGLWHKLFANPGLAMAMHILQYIPDLKLERREDAFLLRVSDPLRQAVLQFGQRFFDAFAKDLDVFYQDTSHRVFSSARFELSVSQDDVRAA